VRECRYVCGGRKGPHVFFPAKKLRNAPWEVVMGVYRMAKTYIARCDILLALFPCVDLDRYCFLL
jgi:hypothetical protein